MEELFINRIEEEEFVLKVGNGAGGVFDGNVVDIEASLVIFAAERFRSKCGDHFLYFCGNGVSPRKVLIVEDCAEKAFGQKMLNQHLLDSVLTNIRVERYLAEVEETGKRELEGFVLDLSFRDQVFKSFGKLRNFGFEIFDRPFEAFMNRGDMREEVIEELNKFSGFGELSGKERSAVLIEDAATCILEDDVGFRIAYCELSLDLQFKNVARVFRFPMAAWDGEFIPQSPVRDNPPSARFLALLFDQCPATMLGGRRTEQIAEGTAEL